MKNAEPRWLDAGEQQTWLALASALIRLPAALDTQLRRDAGISHFEYQVLSMLSMSPERTLRMSALALLAEGSLPRLSQVVGRLERRGWVRRTPDPADGRSTLAVLTDAGWAKIAQAAPGHVETVRRLVFDPLTKVQARQLRDIGRRIVRAIDPGDPCLADQPLTAVTQHDAPRSADRSPVSLVDRTEPVHVTSVVVISPGAAPEIPGLSPAGPG